MKEIDIGNTSPATYTHLESDLTDRPVAAFVSHDGEAFCLESAEVTLRIRYLEANDMETAEERKALKALAAVGA